MSATNSPNDNASSQPAPGEDIAPRLAQVRGRIDEIDAELVTLISERANLAREIGLIKATDNAQIYAPDREKQIYERLKQLNPGPFPDAVLQAIYRELMSGSIALERPQRIAFLGPRGSFSHLASTAKFGASVTYEPVSTIQAAFEEVDRGHVDYAVVPIENSTGGGVQDTLDAFIQTQVKVCAEINLRIHHNVLARVPLERIEKLYSKPEVFEQCRDWLHSTGMHGKTIPTASSSKAAERAASEATSGAIGSTLAAELFDLPLLVRNIEDNPNNTTRFLVLSTRAARPSGDDRTFIRFTTAHQAGALVDVLDVFRQSGVNLTMIQSRPSRRQNWEYYFFSDFEGHSSDANVVKALEAASPHCGELSVLGSYPKAVSFD